MLAIPTSQIARMPIQSSDTVAHAPMRSRTSSAASLRLTSAHDTLRDTRNMANPPQLPRPSPALASSGLRSAAGRAGTRAVDLGLWTSSSSKDATERRQSLPSGVIVPCDCRIYPSRRRKNPWYAHKRRPGRPACRPRATQMRPGSGSRASGLHWPR